MTTTLALIAATLLTLLYGWHLTRRRAHRSTAAEAKLYRDHAAVCDTMAADLEFSDLPAFASVWRAEAATARRIADQLDDDLHGRPR